MNANEIKVWTPEHEAAKQHFIKKFIYSKWESNYETRLLRELIWDKALKDGHLIWAVREGKGHFKYKATESGF